MRRAERSTSRTTKTGGSPAGVPTSWTRPLQWTVAVYSVLAISGTAMVLGYVTPEVISAHTGAAAGEIDGFLPGFRVIGFVFLAANATALLALRNKAWVFYCALAIYLAQGVGFLWVDPEVVGLHGLGRFAHILADGGSGVVALVMLAFLARYRTAWAHRRVPE